MKIATTLYLPLLLSLGAGAALSAQNPTVRPRLTRAIDNSQLTQLHGNVSPQARAAFDRGAAPASMALHRMLLLLKRSPEQELALRQLIEDQQQPSSPQYHRWLTPQQFGQQFGPAPADIQTVTNWLASQGFTVDRVAPGGNVIEFSGTAGAVEAGLHTAIHRYVVNGVTHWANATDPAIPEALTPVVAGVVSLNNFVKPGGRLIGRGTAVKSTPSQPSPSFTFSDPDTGQVEHALVPGDFAILYNVAPLYAATPSINGQGQTIAIVGRTDVDPNDISDFRTQFVPSNPTNLPTVVLNGPDPGDLGGGDESESDLDLEWSGAIAPNATIDFVVSATTDTTDGVDLSAEYIVDNNLAPVMSTSYAGCEADLGTNEESFIGSLYEQAVAQGITVIDSSGDSGVAGCDPNDGSESGATQGAGVSGLASTPFNVAVGGTEFNEGSNIAAYWSPTNDPTTSASVLQPIPETAWNESCLNTPCNSNGPLSATGGGVSIFYTTSNGFPKPSWQSTSITGVPNDGARDVPDIAFSAAGHDGYVVCQARSCQIATNQATGKGTFNFEVFGGTSASAPSFAGVMALVNQKTNAIQGQANYTLYNLAKSENWAQCNSATGAAANCIFLDTTVGNNSVPCIVSSPGCSNGTLTGFSAGTGYDLATGLGSINVANLVDNWTSGTAALASKTTLSLTPTSVVHGQAVTVNITVTQASGAVGPTGDVVLIAEIPTGSNAVGVDFGTLTLGGSTCGTTGCISGVENGLPGGTYNVVARYGGDGTFAPSVSNPVSVTVTPESSFTSLNTYEVNSQDQEIPVTTALYGDFVYFDAFVEGAAGVANNAACNAGEGCINDGVPTGTVAFTNNGIPFAPPGFNGPLPSTLTLNTEGQASYANGITTIPPGTYALVGSYSGDSSFSPSASPVANLTVTPSPSSVTVTTQTSGTSLILTASVGTDLSLGLPPTGTVSFYSGTTALGTAPVTGSNDPNTGVASGTATLTVATPAGGASGITGFYSGDANYSGTAAFTLAVSPTAATLSAGQSTTFAISLNPNGFSGNVALACAGLSGISCTFAPATVALSGTAVGTSTLTVTIPAGSLLPAAPVGAHPGRWPWAVLVALLALLALLAVALAAGRRRRRGWRLVLPAALAMLALSAAACGGGGGSTGTTPTAYTLTITATSGTVATSQNVTLTVN